MVASASACSYQPLCLNLYISQICSEFSLAGYEQIE